MSSVEQARTLAARFWRGELPRRPGKLSGLNGEDKVRARLAEIAGAAECEPEVMQGLAAIDFLRASSQEISERTERLLYEALPAYFPTPHTLLDALSTWTWPLVDLIVVQSVGARQGHWLARDAEVAEARIARELFGPGRAQPAARHAEVVAAAKDAYLAGRHAEAVKLLAEADRGHRSPVALLQLSVALWRLGKLPHALIAVRMALLEEPSSFPTAESLLSAARVESSLRHATEGHAATSEADRAALKVVHDPNARPSYSGRARSQVG